MYALTYKNKSTFIGYFFLAAKHRWISLILLLGLYYSCGGLYIFAKAQFAQVLVAHAWHKNLQSDVSHKPWPWADTHPVAEMSIEGNSWYVLAGASGRNLAFGPTHVSSTSEPGEQGNSVIIGHRDTHFKSLKNLQEGDIIQIKTKHKQQRFQVTMLSVTPLSQLNLLLNNIDYHIFNNDQASITLITCYPFESIDPNPIHRYIVQAIAI